MTKREKAGIVLVVTGFLLVLLGCCMVADNPYWWVSVAISGTGCALIALAVFALPKGEDEARQDKQSIRNALLAGETVAGAALIETPGCVIK